MSKKYILIAIVIIIILSITLLVYMSNGLYRLYKAKVISGLGNNKDIKKSILTEDDISTLPLPIKKYLRYVGAIGKEKVYNFKAVIEGQMKLDPKKDWVKIHAEQFNFYGKEPTRMFYIKAKMSGIPFYGLHAYSKDEARMIIKVAGLIPVVDSKGPEARISDTTTLFNDMCFFAPATLIDSRIEWETVDSHTVRASFENEGCKISAILYFNEKGELINFVSDDRYYTPLDGSSRKARWSTPISNYKDVNGIKLPGYGEAIWNFPEGDLCYAKFSNIVEVEYNCKNFE